MTQFMTSIYSLVFNPKIFLTENIESKNNQFLNFTLFMILLCASCQYIGFANISELGSVLSIFSYIFYMILYSVHFFMLVFLESSITAFFLKNRNVTPFPFGGKQVFIIVGLSYFPYLFFPSISLFSLLVGKDIYYLFILIIFALVLQIRYNFIKHYKTYFNLSSTWIIVIIPTIIQISIVILTFFIFSSTLFFLFLQKFQTFMKQALSSGVF